MERSTAGPVAGADQKANATWIFTPSSSWRWRSLSSCACATSSDSAPEASGRPTIAPRATSCSGAQDNNVVPMPGAVIDQAPLAPTADVAPPTDRWKGIAEPGTPLAQGLDAIAAQDSSFDPRHFSRGARSAYEMIVLAFANGDRRALKDLLSSEVYESFEAVIKDREKHEQKTETRFVSIDKAELVGAEARDRAAQLTVRFVSQMISVTRDKAGTIVDGNPEKVADITDVWTFARDTTSRDPNWKLVGTGSAH